MVTLYTATLLCDAYRTGDPHTGDGNTSPKTLKPMPALYFDLPCLVKGISMPLRGKTLCYLYVKTCRTFQGQDDTGLQAKELRGCKGRG